MQVYTYIADKRQQGRSGGRGDSVRRLLQPSMYVCSISAAAIIRGSLFTHDGMGLGGPESD